MDSDYLAPKIITPIFLPAPSVKPDAVLTV